MASTSVSAAADGRRALYSAAPSRLERGASVRADLAQREGELREERGHPLDRRDHAPRVRRVRRVGEPPGKDARVVARRLLPRVRAPQHEVYPPTCALDLPKSNYLSYLLLPCTCD